MVAPCGYRLPGATQLAEEVLGRGLLPEGAEVWALDADAIVVRPGPRVVEGVETMAAILDPATFGAPDPQLAARLPLTGLRSAHDHDPHGQRRLPPRLPRLVRVDRHRRARRRRQAARQPRPSRTATASCAPRSTASSTASTRPTVCCTRCGAPARRAAAQFEQISWDAALAEIGTRLNAIIAEHGGEAIMPFSDAGNQSLLATQGISDRFFNHIGATQLLRNICGPTVGAGMAMTNGTGLGADPLDIEHSKLILLWGTNTRLTNRHLWPVIERARANGAHVVGIDPIRTITADEADQFIQPLPGTDVAMMLAMMHVIIAEGLVDHEWVDAHTLGFDELAEHVAEWTPAASGGRVRRRCRRDRRPRPRVRHHPPGGDPHADRRRAPRARGDVLPHAGLPAGAHRRVARSRRRASCAASARGRTSSSTTTPSAGPTCSPAREPRTLNMSRLGEILLDEQPPVKAMIVWNCNPLVIVPNAERAREGHGPRRPVHDRPRAVPHRHGASTPTSCCRPPPTSRPTTSPPHGATCGWVGTRPPSSRSANRSATPSASAGSPARWGSPSRRCSTTTSTVLRESPADGRPRRAARRRLDQGAVPRGRAAVGRRRLPHRVGQARVRQRAARRRRPPARCPTYTPAIEGPRGANVARFPLQLMTPKHHARFLNSGYSHLPKHGPAEGGPFVELDLADAEAPRTRRGRLRPRVQRPRQPRAPGQDLRPAAARAGGDPVRLVAPPAPDGKVANSLTNDTLTDWGGGVAFSDTLVQIERA